MLRSSSPVIALQAQEAAEDQRLLAKAAQIQAESRRYSCLEANETTPWLKHTRWPEWFQNRPLDVVAATAQKPSPCTGVTSEDYTLGRWEGTTLVSPAENEAKLRLLMQAADQMFARAEGTLRQTPYRLRCWLNSYQKDGFYPKAMNVLPARSGYYNLWKQFLCYVFRVLALRPSQRRRIYNVRFQPGEVQMMVHVLSLLDEIEGCQPDPGESKDEETAEESSEDDLIGTDIESEGVSDSAADSCSESDASEDSDTSSRSHRLSSRVSSSYTLPSGLQLQLSEALFQLSMMFWTYRDTSGDMASSTLIHFAGVLGIHRHSLAYKSAYNSTPCFAHLIWLGRLLFLEYALPLHPYTTLAYPWPDRNAYPDQAGRLEEIRTKYLLRGSLGPIAEILELKAFAKAIIKREGIPANLSWARDGQSFTLSNNRRIRVLDLPLIYHRAIDQVKEKIDHLMLGWQPTVDLAGIQDDLACQTPGWSFLAHPDNNLQLAYKELARRAWGPSFSGRSFSRAGHWLSEACSAYLESGTQVASEIFAALHITAGLPGRGTETSSIRVLNTQLAIRHVFVREGRILIVLSYNKARASNNYAFYIVRYIPSGLDASMFKYLVYIRPFIDFLAGQLEMPKYQSTEFLFPDPGLTKKHLSSPQASRILQHLTGDLLTPWTLSLYRQAAVTIAKRYIKELIEKIDFYNPLDASDPIRMIATGTGHHPRTLLGAYAVDKALPSRLQPELLEMYYRLSTIWQSWNRQYYEDHCQDRRPDQILPREVASLPSPPPSSPPTLPAGLKRPASPGLSCPRAPKQVCRTGPSCDPSPQGGFQYNAEYRVLICLACESILQPQSTAWYRHLNSLHQIKGPACKALLERFARYDLCALAELAVPQVKTAPIPGLKVQGGFRCNICPSSLGPSFFTICREKMNRHLSRHQINPKGAWQSGKAAPCYLQTFSLAKGLIQYFEVDRES